MPCLPSLQPLRGCNGWFFGTGTLTRHASPHHPRCGRQPRPFRLCSATVPYTVTGGRKNVRRAAAAPPCRVAATFTGSYCSLPDLPATAGLATQLQPFPRLADTTLLRSSPDNPTAPFSYTRCNSVPITQHISYPVTWTRFGFRFPVTLWFGSGLYLRTAFTVPATSRISALPSPPRFSPVYGYGHYQFTATLHTTFAPCTAYRWFCTFPR